MSVQFKRLVGHLWFVVAMIALVWIGEPLAADSNLTLKNIVAMSTLPLLAGYAFYHMGWINGHYAGWQKARGYEK